MIIKLLTITIITEAIVIIIIGVCTLQKKEIFPRLEERGFKIMMLAWRVEVLSYMLYLELIL